MEPNQAADQGQGQPQGQTPPTGNNSNPPSQANPQTQPPTQGQGNNPKPNEQNRGSAPPPHPDLSRQPAAPGEIRVNPIWVSPDDWRSTQNEIAALREFKREQDRLMDLKEAERAKLLMEKGQGDEALASVRTSYEKKLAEQTAKADQIETKWLNQQKTSAINDILTGRQFVGPDPQETAATVRTLLELELEAVRDGSGNALIRDRVTMRAAADYLRERIDSPKYSVFFAATNRGGAGTDGTRPAGSTQKPNDDPTAEFAKQFRERQMAYQNATYLGGSGGRSANNQ